MTTPTKDQIKRSVDTLMKDVVKRVNARWAPSYMSARDMLGDKIYEALLCQELLILCDAQADEIDDRIVRDILTGGRSWIIDHMNEVR